MESQSTQAEVACDSAFGISDSHATEPRLGSLPDKFQSGTHNESLIVNGGRVHPTWTLSYKLHVRKRFY
jgi:hypothetical protein